MNRIFATIALAAALAMTATAQDPVGTVTNSFTLFQETLGSRQVPVIVTIVVTYPDNLEDDKYIDLVTVSQDVQGFLRAYPNRQAALEVYAANAATLLMKKYAQITAASISLTNNNAGIQVTAERAIPAAPKQATAALQAERERALKLAASRRAQTE